MPLKHDFQEVYDLLDEVLDDKALKRIGDKVIGRIRRLASYGLNADKRKMEDYTPKYKAKKRRAGKRMPPTTMKFNGSMLKNLRTKVKKTKITIETVNRAKNPNVMKAELWMSGNYKNWNLMTWGTDLQKTLNDALVKEFVKAWNKKR